MSGAPWVMRIAVRETQFAGDGVCPAKPPR